jgi:hypothetical protein
MNIQTKTAMLTILSIGLLSALTLSTLTLGVSPAFAHKKKCDKTDNGCDAKKSEMNKDHTQDKSQIQLPSNLQPENPFALTGITVTNSTNE